MVPTLAFYPRSLLFCSAWGAFFGRLELVLDPHQPPPKNDICKEENVRDGDKKPNLTSLSRRGENVCRFVNDFQGRFCLFLEKYHLLCRIVSIGLDKKTLPDDDHHSPYCYALSCVFLCWTPCLQNVFRNDGCRRVMWTHPKESLNTFSDVAPHCLTTLVGTEHQISNRNRKFNEAVTCLIRFQYNLLGLY